MIFSRRFRPPAVLCLLIVGIPALAQPRDYSFDRTISEPVLRSYLARSITFMDLLTRENELDENVRMLKSVGAKFAGRTVYLWGHESEFPKRLDATRRNAPRVRAADPEIVLQACLFEIVTREVETLPIPESTFAAFKLPPEKRNFRYLDMLFPAGRFHNHWGMESSVPDISRPEVKLFFYTLATAYIDAGIEALHVGQVELMNAGHRDYSDWAELLSMIRQYAARHARRHMVIIDAHVPTGGLIHDGKLLLDFHSFPLRIMETPDQPQKAILKKGFADSIYGRSKGGVTPSGWKCEHLPVLVEFDNWGVTKTPGKARSGGIWIWGYDEITWYAHQDEAYRNEFLRYAFKTVRELDPDAYLQMPGSRGIHYPLKGNIGWYSANPPSATIPNGFNQEPTIRELWGSKP